ncbi:MAG TPA: peroxiredoxin family protein [Abditibacteriaceae bacterium]|jgi:peroxiredoxin Q/BCP
MFKFQNGDPAGPITLRDVKGKEWNLADFKGKMVALYFARGEYCPTTRGEFALWNSFHATIKKMNCEMVFVVNGGREEHRKFCEELRMRLRVLVDDDGAVGEAYGVYGVNHNDLNREHYRNYIAPAMYLIDAEGNVSGFWIASAPRGLPTPETLLGILAYAEHNNWKY